jgi:hypothetical protein
MNEADIQALDAMLAMSDPAPQTQPNQGAKLMKKLVDVRTYVNGRDISTVTSEELVSMIKMLEVEQADLAKISTESRALNSRKRDIDNALAVLAARLDALYDQEHPEAAAPPAPVRSRR